MPDLPPSKREAVEKLGRGITTTVYLRFRERFWPERLAFLFHSMTSQCFWPGIGAAPVLTAYFGGKTANSHLLALSDDDMANEIVRQLEVIFSRPSGELRASLVRAGVRRWDTEEFSKMSYS